MCIEHCLKAAALDRRSLCCRQRSRSVTLAPHVLADPESLDFQDPSPGEAVEPRYDPGLIAEDNRQQATVVDAGTSNIVEVELIVQELDIAPIG